MSLLLIFVLSINFVSAPYNINGSKKVKGFNLIKPMITGNARSVKPLIIKNLFPDAIIIGASSTEMGFNPDHIGFKDYKNTYNFGVAGGYFYEVYRHLQHSIKVTDLKLAIISIDYLMWLVRNELHAPTFNENFLAVNNQYSDNYDWEDRFFWSLHPSRLSNGFKTLIFQDVNYINNEFFPRFFLKDNGQRRDDSYLRLKKLLSGFDEPFKKSIYKNFNKLSVIDHRIVDKKWINELSYFDMIENIISLAANNNVKVVFNFPPCHLSALEIFRQAKKLDSFNDFKIRVASLIKNTKLKYPDVDVSLYDFCVYDDLLNEIVIDANNKKLPFLSFTDPFHFRSSLGDKALDYMLLDKKNSSAFGQNLLKLKNFEMYFYKQDQQYNIIKENNNSEILNYRRCMLENNC